MIKQNGKKKILLGKLGLDAHDNGIVIVAKWLSDAGFEIVYLGFYNFPEQLIDAALQEDVDAIGVSFLGGEHLYYTRKLIALMKGKNMNDVKLIIGGVIPTDDAEELKAIGVAEVFTPGTQRDTIIETLKDLLNKEQ